MVLVWKVQAPVLTPDALILPLTLPFPFPHGRLRFLLPEMFFASPLEKVVGGGWGQCRQGWVPSLKALFRTPSNLIILEEACEGQKGVWDVEAERNCFWWMNGGLCISWWLNISSIRDEGRHEEGDEREYSLVSAPWLTSVINWSTCFSLVAGPGLQWAPV